ncbi:MAG: hypothetical protein E4H03_07015 [Myxococcales bacterium]|nr:MAG: hypothetical protein E4H03_07015 [Myxococcales bacterium]
MDSKLKKLITIAFSTLVLALQMGLIPPPEAQAQEEEMSSEELKCRRALARSSTQYFNQTMAARQACEQRRLSGRISSDTDCRALATEIDCTSDADCPVAAEAGVFCDTESRTCKPVLNDPQTVTALERAGTRLNSGLVAGCDTGGGVDLTQLGFPGICGSPDDGEPFDINDLRQCIASTTFGVVDALLDINFPTLDGLFTKGQTRCAKIVNDRSRRLARKETRSRQECLLKQEGGRLGALTPVDCRESVPPYGSGTGDRNTDKAIVSSYRSLLSDIPPRCATANVRALYADNGCIDSTAGSFNVFDLQVCVFDSSRAAHRPLLELSFPSPPECGNGTVEGGEACDNGSANSINGPCLPDCTLAACPDGNLCNAGGCTTGPGGGVEQCDDGNQNPNDVCPNACSSAFCGDSFVCNVAGCTSGPGGGVEQCDAGATQDTGRCLTTCANATCGDGEVCTELQCTTGPDGGAEACDDAGESVNCNSDCSPSLCGDAKLNVTDGEECDDGFILMDIPNACRRDCTLPVCGDMIVDDAEPFGEECDPPDGSTCSETCTIVAPPTCGDGTINGPCTGDSSITCTSNAECQSAGAGTCDLEECDDGAGNSDTTPNACRANCMLPVCGDGVIDDQSGEACDNGAANAANAPCVSTCQRAVCGDGNTCTVAGCNTGPAGGLEQCDDGSGNSDTTPNACRADCANPGCGDSVIDSGEQCDDGSANSDTAPDACRTSCDRAFCGDSVTDSGEECDNGGANSDSAACLSSCVDAVCGDGVQCSAGDCSSGPGGGAEACDDGSANSTSSRCMANCAAATCGDGIICSDSGCTTGPGAGPEECDEGSGNGIACTSQCGCAEGATVTGCLELQCPIKGELVIFAGVTNDSCTTDDDCPVPPEAGGFCDTGLGMCRTTTDLDTGWKGVAHDSDITDRITAVGSLSCPGPFDPTSAEPCGECEVTGILPEPRNCRCSNNIRTICDNTFELDPDDCTLAGVTCNVDNDCKRCSESLEISCLQDLDCPQGEACQAGLSTPSCINNQCVGTCNCYFGPPLALSAANVPACVVNRFANDISGTANVDLGAGEITANLRSTVYLGELTTVPCPVCGGSCDAPAASVGKGCIFDFNCDGGLCSESLEIPCRQDIDCPDGESCEATANGVCGNFDTAAGDGIREGTCVFGLTSDRPCDVDATNVTFPFPGGGGHSLDCPPSTGKNVSGQGLVIDLAQTTGSVQLESDVPCGFTIFGNPPSCQCGLCGGNGDPCSGDADCAPGVVCTRRSQGDPLPNDCGQSACVVDPARGGNNGICETGSLQFCDGALKSNGEPFVTCLSDADCAAQVCGEGSCGTCTLLRPKPCFLETITAEGRADPEFPTGATIFCIGPTANPGINSAAGLPGPGRVVNQARSTTFCASDPSVPYIPGVGGCPIP